MHPGDNWWQAGIMNGGYAPEILAKSQIPAISQYPQYHVQVGKATSNAIGYDGGLCNHNITMSAIPGTTW